MDPYVQRFNEYAEGNHYPQAPADALFPDDAVCIMADEDYGSWGHTSVALLVKNELGYWSGDGGGCSCGGSTSTHGPYETAEEALKYIGDSDRLKPVT